jgi:hypothetical protein
MGDHMAASIRILLWPDYTTCKALECSALLLEHSVRAHHRKRTTIVKNIGKRLLTDVWMQWYGYSTALQNREQTGHRIVIARRNYSYSVAKFHAPLAKVIGQRGCSFIQLPVGDVTCPADHP